MATNKVDLLREHQLGPAFRKALRRTGAGVIAVPFWGRGALKLLGLDGGANVRIICNLDHPGCNPFVIEQLRDHKVKVRTHKRLHAKIYGTADMAIVGSSNASSNGLTVEGREAQGWVELNVVSCDPMFVADVLGEFENLWESDETLPVLATDIKRAKQRRANMPPFMPVLPKGQEFFEAVRANPKLFAEVYLAIYDKPLSREAKRVMRDVQSNAVERPRDGFDTSTLKNAWGYQFEDVPRDAWLVDVSSFKEKPPRYVGVARSTGLAMKVPEDEDGEEQIDLTLALSGPILIGGRRLRPNAAERALLEQHAKRLLKAAGGELLPIAKAVAIIDRAR
jgi:PLD-like domain